MSEPDNEPSVASEPDLAFRYCLYRDDYDFSAENVPAASDDALIVRLERAPDRDDGAPYTPTDVEILPILFQRACEAARPFPEAFTAIQTALVAARAEYRGLKLQRK